MSRRMILAAAAVSLSAGVAVPALAAAPHAAPSVPPACVVVNGPSGASIQVGYAPTGPTGCTTLP